jgi:hypothetical protein
MNLMLSILGAISALSVLLFFFFLCIAVVLLIFTLAFANSNCN